MNDLIAIINNTPVLDIATINKIVEFEKKLKELKDAEDKLKAAIFEEMESKGVIKLETDALNITYIEPTTKETLDSKTLKEELPDIYDAYVKISPVKASIRLKVK